MFGTFPTATLTGGGVTVQVAALAKELRKLEVEVELFDTWKSYELSAFDIFHLFGAHVGTFHLGRSVRNLGLRLLVSPVFYSRQSARRLSTMLAVARRLRRKGGFWTEHMFCRELCEMADRVLPNTDAEARLISRGLSIPRSKIAIVPNGVDEKYFFATPRRFHSQFGVRDFLLYVGHIGWGRKNLLPFLEVAARLEYPTVLIGQLVHTEYGRKCSAKIEQSPNITHIPALPPNSDLLASAYAACNTFVLPSYFETPGLAALEAGLAGAKICITKHGGTREYFGQMATYIDPESPESIAAAVESALQKPRGEALKEHIRRNFLWGEAAKKLVAAYST